MCIAQLKDLFPCNEVFNAIIHRFLVDPMALYDIDFMK